MFVGESRIALVDGLVDLLDEVVRSEQPLWVSLEAPSGWGKTRVAQEFYARLAARQSSPAYWPASIVSDDDAAPEHRRKKVFPESMTVPAGALPEWAWLGISCSSRPGGSPVAALRSDVAQLEAHLPWLQDRWRRCVSRSTRFALWTKGRSSTGRALAQEALSMVMSVSGMSLGLLLVEQSIDAGRELAGRHRRMSTETDISAGMPSDEIAADCAEQLLRIAVPGLPVIVFVEDLQHADPTLVDMLRRLVVARSGAVMIITTAWPGHLEGGETLSPMSELFESMPERVRRVAVGAPAPSGFPPAAGFDELPLGDRCRLVQVHLPTADDATVDLVATRFVSPYALELFCNLGRVRRQTQLDGALSLTAEDVASAPADVIGLLRVTWKEMPAQVRLGLTIAALGCPRSINEEWSGGDVRWNGPAITQAMIDSNMLDIADLETLLRLDEQSTAYGWARAVDDWLRRFIEPDQMQIALEHAEDELTDADVRRFHTALATQVGLDGQEDDPLRLHHGRTILALHAEGFIDGGPAIADAALVVLESETTGSPLERRRLAELGLANVEDLSSRSGFALRTQLSSTYSDAGLVQAAIQLTSELVNDQIDILGSDHPDTLHSRHNLAFFLGQSRQYNLALQQLGDLEADTKRLLGPTHQLTLVTRKNIAYFISLAGDHELALEIERELFVVLEELLGPEHPYVLSIRNNIAFNIDRCGDHREALRLWTELLDDYNQTFGPDYPFVLFARANVAGSLKKCGEFDSSLSEFMKLEPDLERVLGYDHPDTVMTRAAIAEIMFRIGDIEGSRPRFRSAAHDHLRIFGIEHPQTVGVLVNFATCTGLTGNPTEAVEILQEVRRHHVPSVGEDHERFFELRRRIAEFLRLSGDMEQAVHELRSLHADQRRLLGELHPDTQSTADRLAELTSQ